MYDEDLRGPSGYRVDVGPTAVQLVDMPRNFARIIGFNSTPHMEQSNRDITATFEKYGGFPCPDAEPGSRYSHTL